MVNKRNILVAATVAVGAMLLFFLFSGSEKDAVRQQFERLSDLAAKEIGEPPLLAAKKAAAISQLFMVNARMEVTARSFSRDYSRDEVRGAVLLARGRFTEARLDFHDLNIDLTGQGTANVITTARTTGIAAGEQFADVHEIEATLHKVEGEWLFQRLTVVEVLEK